MNGFAEALAERGRLLRLAPHLVSLEPFLFPVYGIPLVHQAFYGSGILLYDLLGARHDGGFARHLRPSSVLEYAPQLKPRGLTGGIVYHNGVEDGARLALAVLRTARHGGVAATRVRAGAAARARPDRRSESERLETDGAFEDPRRPGHRCPASGQRDPSNASPGEGAGPVSSRAAGRTWSSGVIGSMPTAA